MNDMDCYDSTYIRTENTKIIVNSKTYSVRGLRRFVMVWIKSFNIGLILGHTYFHWLICNDNSLCFSLILVI